jgi:hypothetical protein
MLAMTLGEFSESNVIYRQVIDETTGKIDDGIDGISIC